MRVYNLLNLYWLRVVYRSISHRTRMNDTNEKKKRRKKKSPIKLFSFCLRFVSMTIATTKCLYMAIVSFRIVNAATVHFWFYFRNIHETSSWRSWLRLTQYAGFALIDPFKIHSVLWHHAAFRNGFRSLLDRSLRIEFKISKNKTLNLL